MQLIILASSPRPACFICHPLSKKNFVCTSLYIFLYIPVYIYFYIFIYLSIERCRESPSWLNPFMGNCDLTIHCDINQQSDQKEKKGNWKRETKRGTKRQRKKKTPKYRFMFVLEIKRKRNREKWRRKGWSFFKSTHFISVVFLTVIQSLCQ